MTRKPFELPTGEELDRLIGPIPMPAASGDWISAREARLLVAREAMVSFEEAESALCRRALKWLRVRPHTWTRREVPHDYIPRGEFCSGEPDLSHFGDLPSRIAWEEGLGLFDALMRHTPFLAPSPGVVLSCWATGDFVVAVEKDFSVVHFEIVGLQFDRVGVLDSIGLKPALGAEAKRKAGPGRAPKWDWESALAAVTAVANAPDGLPEGRGAQAAVERIISDHFGPDGPVESQVRLRAAKIMDALDAFRSKSRQKS